MDRDAFEDSLIVFDWDDTILPTSWLERVGALCQGPLRPDIQRQISVLAAASLTTLNLAKQIGTVIFITNSAPGWMDQSCQLFMPQLLQEIRSYPISAKPMHAPLTFKIAAFRRECRAYTNIISVGDGDAERTASLRLTLPEPGARGGDVSGSRRIKSLKLLDLPTCQQLVAQHEMLQIRLADVLAFQGSLDLKARSSGGGPLRGSPTNGRGPGAGIFSLVHFSRPQASPFMATDPWSFKSSSSPTAITRETSAPAPTRPSGPDAGTQSSMKMMAAAQGQRGSPPPPHGGGSPQLKSGISSSALPPLGSVLNPGGSGVPRDSPSELCPARSQSAMDQDGSRGGDRDGTPSRSRFWRVHGTGASGGFAGNSGDAGGHGPPGILLQSLASEDVKKKRPPGSAPRGTWKERSTSWSAAGRA